VQEEPDLLRKQDKTPPFPNLDRGRLLHARFAREADEGVRPYTCFNCSAQ
jgi:hypothetical protein